MLKVGQQTSVRHAVAGMRVLNFSIQGLKKCGRINSLLQKNLNVGVRAVNDGYAGSAAGFIGLSNPSGRDLDRKMLLRININRVRVNRPAATENQATNEPSK